MGMECVSHYKTNPRFIIFKVIKKMGNVYAKLHMQVHLFL